MASKIIQNFKKSAFLHGYTGCDTTSGLAGKGEIKTINPRK